jgi:hypothetical protein
MFATRSRALDQNEEDATLELRPDTVSDGIARRRLVAALLFGAALVTCGVLAVAAYAVPSPYARAGLVRVSGH